MPEILRERAANLRSTPISWSVAGGECSEPEPSFFSWPPRFAIIPEGFRFLEHFAQLSLGAGAQLHGVDFKIKISCHPRHGFDRSRAGVHGHHFVGGDGSGERDAGGVILDKRGHRRRCLLADTSKSEDLPHVVWTADQGQEVLGQQFTSKPKFLFTSKPKFLQNPCESMVGRTR